MFQVLFAMFLPAALLVGQGTPSASKDPGAKGDTQGNILLRLHRVRSERLQQALGIPEDKARAIADRWGQFDLDNRDLRKRIRQLHEQVNGLLFGPLPEDDKNARIRPLMEQFAILQRQQLELRRRFEEDVRNALSPAQQGRLILVVDEIQRALIEEIHKQRKAISGE
ncbi:MAG TPA: hypothetical protein VN436_14875 [Holophaga sp.]|nr:hypothetical protein [Holophaga sp.]